MNYHGPNRFRPFHTTVTVSWNAQQYALSIRWEGFNRDLTEALQQGLPRTARWWSPASECWYVRPQFAAQLRRALVTPGVTVSWHVPEEIIERKAS